MPLRTLLAAATLVAMPLTAAQAAQPTLGSEAEKMAAFDDLRGEWRGTATATDPTGTVSTFTQTERVGPLLGGDVLVVEGRGYDDAGDTVFNALGVISWNAAKGAYEFHTYAEGYEGTYPIQKTEDGFDWQIDTGTGGIIEYEATVTGDTWVETGTYVMGEQRYPFFEMRLERIGDTDWPAAGGVSPQD